VHREEIKNGEGFKVHGSELKRAVPKVKIVPKIVKTGAWRRAHGARLKGVVIVTLQIPRISKATILLSSEVISKVTDKRNIF